MLKHGVKDNGHDESTFSEGLNQMLSCVQGILNTFVDSNWVLLVRTFSQLYFTEVGFKSRSAWTRLQMPVRRENRWSGREHT